jgi:hypothetical protein
LRKKNIYIKRGGEPGDEKVTSKRIFSSSGLCFSFSSHMRARGVKKHKRMVRK